MDGIELVVLHHFEGYVRGDVISDQEKIAEVLSGPHELHVTKRKSLAVQASVTSTEVPAIASYKIG